MKLTLGCIADDYTGASDLANTLTREGLRTIQTIGIPYGLDLGDVDAVVIALRSRSAPAAEAVTMTLAARDWLRNQGARHILFKICSTFDSTCEGNIGPVTDALGAGDIALVTPAFPEVERTVYLGHLFVGDCLLDESPMRDHPLNPMRDANLLRFLSSQSRQKIGLIDLAAVEGGDDAIVARRNALAAAGVGIAIVDAVFEAHLDAVGRVALTMPFSVGASGLGRGLARAILAGNSILPAEAFPPIERKGAIAFLSGSCSAATLAQVEAARSVMPVLELDPAELIVAGVGKALSWAASRLGEQPLLLSVSAAPAAVDAVQSRFGRDAAGKAIEAALAEIAAGLVAAGVRRLVVAGGETSGAVIDRLDLPAFAIGPEIASGVPLLMTVGTAEPLLLALKSGNFGGTDFFSRAAAMMGWRQ